MNSVCLYAALNIFKQMENSSAMSRCFLGLVCNFKFLDLIETWWRNHDILYEVHKTSIFFMFLLDVTKRQPAKVI